MAAPTSNASTTVNANPRTPKTSRRGRPSNSELLHREGKNHTSNLKDWLITKKRARSSPGSTSPGSKRLFTDSAKMGDRSNESENMAPILKEVKEMRRESREDKKELLDKIEQSYSELKRRLDEQERRWVEKWQNTDKRIADLEDSINTRNTSQLQDADREALTHCQRWMEGRRRRGYSI